MAKRKYSAKKLQPAVETVTLVTPTTLKGTLGSYTLDLSQIASIVNRRFYRQGIQWAVGGFKIFSAAPGSVSVSKLPQNWVTSNSWEKSFRMWNKQTMDTIEEVGAESKVARFRDFKIHMDPFHVTEGFGNNLLPVDASGNTALPGEWDRSQIVVPNAALDATGSRVLPKEYALHMVGFDNENSTARGMIEGYMNSRAYPASPDPVHPPTSTVKDWMRDMFNVGENNSDIVTNALEQNDDLPYPQEHYPGGDQQLPGLQFHDQASITNTTVGGVTRLKGGTFPCGLIRIQHNIPANPPEGGPYISANLVIQIDLVPGSHRGYLCAPMQDM